MRPFNQRRDCAGSGMRLCVSQVAPTAVNVLRASTLHTAQVNLHPVHLQVHVLWPADGGRRTDTLAAMLHPCAQEP